jgi:hypothetical protein
MPPGTYTATLEIGGAKASQTFTVVNDPASAGTLAGMTERYRVTAAVLHEISQIDVALNRLHAIRVQLDRLRRAVQGLPEGEAVKTAIRTLARARRALLLKLTSDAGSSESTLWVPDRIHEKLMALEQLLQGSDEPVDAATLHEQAVYRREYRSAIATYDRFLRTAVAHFNRTVAGYGLGVVASGAALQP